MSKLTVYLAGPITGLTYKDANKWRQEFKEKYGDVFEIKSPLDRENKYQGRQGKEVLQEIAYDERLDILNSDATIAYHDKPSAGTAMGILYAYLSGRTVVLVVPGFSKSENGADAQPVNNGTTKTQPDSSGYRLSPMLQHHNHKICDSFEEAVRFIMQRHGRSTIKTIKDRNGKFLDWQPDKITHVIQKAIDGVFSINLENELIGLPKADKITNAVIMKLEDDLENKTLSYEEIDEEKIQDTIEHILMANSHIKEVNTLAKEFIIYRSKRTEERVRRQEEQSSQIIDDETRQFLRDIMHDMKDYVGWAGRFINTAIKLAPGTQNEKLIQNIEKAKENIETTKRLFDEASSKIEHRFKIEEINLNQFMHDLLEKKDDPYIHFNVNIDDNLLIGANHYKLRSVFNVIIDNTIKHGLINKKGNIHISIRRKQNTNDIEIDYWNDGKIVNIHDTEFIARGSKDHMPKKGNWRHGMLQVSRYIRDMGGVMELFPAEIIEDNGKRIPSKAREGYYCIKIIFKKKFVSKPKEKYLLVVDDNPTDRQNLIFAITSEYENIKILEASNIKEAVAIINDTILYGMITDLDLKDDKNGLWLIEYLYGKSPETKSVLVSGVGSKYGRTINWKAEAEALGAKAFDKIDYDIADIMKYIQGAL